MKNVKLFLKEERFRAIAGWLIFMGTGMFSAIFLSFLVYHSWGRESWIVDIVKDHFQATVGLPMAAIAAVCIVFLFKFVEGTIELEGLGFKFKGASAPIILWILCFLAIASAIKVLW
jgi:hypothetical protein